jgi:prolipoprotein diacylglyceryltransferase
MISKMTSRTKQLNDWSKQQVEDMIFYGAIGVVFGGRIGYMLFYGATKSIVAKKVLLYLRLNNAIPNNTPKNPP